MLEIRKNIKDFDEIISRGFRDVFPESERIMDYTALTLRSEHFACEDVDLDANANIRRAGYLIT